MITRHMLITTAVLAFLLLPSTLAAESGFVVSSSQVAEALREGGKAVDADHIHLLSPVRSRRPHAALKLMSVGEWQDGVMKAEMRCTNRSACLPFFVLVQDSAGLRDAVGRRPAQSLASSPATAKTYDVHIGDPATLVLETKESRIVMRVICAQNGDRGQKIRVASRDHKRFYEAEVIEPGFLRGTL